MPRGNFIQSPKRIGGVGPPSKESDSFCFERPPPHGSRFVRPCLGLKLDGKRPPLGEASLPYFRGHLFLLLL